MANRSWRVRLVLILAFRVRVAFICAFVRPWFRFLFLTQRAGERPNPYAFMTLIFRRPLGVVNAHRTPNGTRSPAPSTC